MKGLYEILDLLISETQETLKDEDKVKKFNCLPSLPKRKGFNADYSMVLDKGALKNEMHLELKQLLQSYGKELIDVINNSNGEACLAEIISVFVYEANASQRNVLATQLNVGTDEDNLKEYDLNDYLILGFKFYDALFYCWTHKYEVERFIQWGIDYSDYYAEISAEIGTGTDVLDRKKPHKSRKLKP